jgi:hypothetical protein
MGFNSGFKGLMSYACLMEVRGLVVARHITSRHNIFVAFFELHENSTLIRSTFPPSKPFAMHHSTSTVRFKMLSVSQENKPHNFQLSKAELKKTTKYIS